MKTFSLPVMAIAQQPPPDKLTASIASGQLIDKISRECNESAGLDCSAL
jgi:hypothetical protein